MKNRFNAFVDEELEVEPIYEGELSNYVFSVKDVFSIKGVTSSAGNPDWLKTHLPADKHASAITKLLEAGARLRGTTITDELMYSLNGENIHYGTPENPKAKGRIPGGSSSGSAVAVSAELVDFALGTDTGGSVRVPAAYCGIYGFRPTHGAVAMEGVIPLAESFDTVGWMTRTPQLLAAVGNYLLDEQVCKASTSPFSTVLLGKDAFELADYESRATFSLFIDCLLKETKSSEWVEISKEGLEVWANCFRTIQGIEIWNTHGEWVDSVKPNFGRDIKARFQWASTLTEQEGKQEQMLRQEIQERMEQLLGEDRLLIIPTTPGSAPLCHLSGDEIEKRRSQTMQLSSIAGLAGLPQVTIPLKGESSLPIALSVIAGRNQDKRLMQWVCEQKDRLGLLKFQGNS